MLAFFLDMFPFAAIDFGFENKRLFIIMNLFFIIVLFASSDSTGPSGSNKTDLATS